MMIDHFPFCNYFVEIVSIYIVFELVSELLHFFRNLSASYYFGFWSLANYWIKVFLYVVMLCLLLNIVFCFCFFVSE
jgi:hypothetical protein